ncbi:hypothetical protein G7Y41_07060 [Schaalia sp. ZJ405]|uniref:hypothetical protein n=1 Tax=Schaalia sp. ZJ405 TaxID=2709403 RepID=UPI0013EC1394|nr:hypothetical protein [Schaalia sp. ZJ405]QPK80812.1 hypothetical protein G7Y41_07060 [Schaalia sp. ZJ405]
MNIIDKVFAFGDQHLTPRPSDDEVLRFQVEIYEDAAAIISILSLLQEQGVYPDAETLREIAAEYEGFDDLTEYVDELLEESMTVA